MDSEENDDNAARQEAPGDTQPRPWGVKEGFLGEADVMMDRKRKRLQPSVSVSFCCVTNGSAALPLLTRGTYSPAPESTGHLQMG